MPRPQACGGHRGDDDDCTSVHRTLAITVALVATLAVAAPALAKAGNAGGNSAASAACEGDGFLGWTDAAGAPFRNAGACVSYAAKGGTLVPVVVVVNPFTVSYMASGERIPRHADRDRAGA